MNVLLVDDSQTVRAVLEKTLRLAQVPLEQVHHAGNGQEALAQLAAHPVDMIFADINMPIMNGVQLVQELAKQGTLRTTPVIIISTDGSQTRLDVLRALGVSGFVRKPFRPEQIRDAINAIQQGAPHVGA